MENLFNKNIKIIMKECERNECKKNNYITKTRNDKFTCTICKGSYTRSQKSTHVNTKKHQKKVNELRDKFNNLFSNLIV